MCTKYPESLECIDYTEIKLKDHLLGIGFSELKIIEAKKKFDDLFGNNSVIDSIKSFGCVSDYGFNGFGRTEKSKSLPKIMVTVKDKPYLFLNY